MNMQNNQKTLLDSFQKYVSKQTDKDRFTPAIKDQLSRLFTFIKDNHSKLDKTIEDVLNADITDEMNSLEKELYKLKNKCDFYEYQYVKASLQQIIQAEEFQNMLVAINQNVASIKNKYNESIRQNADTITDSIMKLLKSYNIDSFDIEKMNKTVNEVITFSLKTDIENKIKDINSLSKLS